MLLAGIDLTSIKRGKRYQRASAHRRESSI